LPSPKASGIVQSVRFSKLLICYNLIDPIDTGYVPEVYTFYYIKNLCEVKEFLQEGDKTLTKKISRKYIVRNGG
jgi:hypothetical protein